MNYRVKLRLQGEQVWTTRGLDFNNRADAETFARADGAFQPPEAREYMIEEVEAKEDDIPFEESTKCQADEMGQKRIIRGLQDERDELVLQRDEARRKLEQYGQEIAHLQSQQFEESQRQLILMSLADCVTNRPGFDLACSEVARQLNGEAMYDGFKVTSKRFKFENQESNDPKLARVRQVVGRWKWYLDKLKQEPGVQEEVMPLFMHSTEIEEALGEVIESITPSPQTETPKPTDPA